MVTEQIPVYKMPGYESWEIKHVGEERLAARAKVLAEVRHECLTLDRLHGGKSEHDDNLSFLEWLYNVRQVHEMLGIVHSKVMRRSYLLKLAALCVTWAESMDRGCGG